MEKKSTHAPKAPAQTFAKQELLRKRQAASSSAPESRERGHESTAQSAVHRVRSVVDKAREEVNEQPEVSPGEYAEQRVESYTGSTLRYAEAKLESAGNALRRHAIRQYQERRQDDKLADEEQTDADVEIREETVELDSPSTYTGGYTPDGAHPDTLKEPGGEAIQNEQPRQEAQKHLTYRDKYTIQPTTEPADRNPSAGSSISEDKGGRAHAQRQPKRSEWQENASGIRVQDQTGRTPSAGPAEGVRRPVSPTQGVLPGAEKETGLAGPTQRAHVKGVRQSLNTAGKAGQTTQQTTKTVQQSARTAQKTAQASAKAAQAAKEASVKAGRAAVKVGQAAYKVLEAVIRAIMEGAKALATAIAAGGWVAVLVIAILMKTSLREDVLAFLRKLFPPVRNLSMKLSSSRVASVLSMMLHHEPGVLSALLLCVSQAGASVLTIDQSLPIHGKASIMLSIAARVLCAFKIYSAVISCRISRRS